MFRWEKMVTVPMTVAEEIREHSWMTSMGKLRYRCGEKWKRLPLWSKFLATLGAAAVRGYGAGLRTVTVITAPTRSFCAPFAALGSLFTLSSIQSDLDSEKHFQTLCELSSQSDIGLVYFRDGRRHDAVFAGVQKVGGVPYIRVCVQAHGRERTGGATFFVNAEECANVHIRADGAVCLSRSWKGRKLSRYTDFTATVLGDAQTPELSLPDGERGILIVGRVNALRVEVTQEVIGFPSAGQMIEGCLQALLQVRKFSSSGDQGLVDVAPSSGKGPSTRLHPRLVIFDDNSGYLRCREQFPSSNILVVLDRTDPHFQEAVSATNAAFMKRDGEVVLDDLIRPPRGLELMSHLEKA
jgi:hypothetical protein